MKEMYHQFKEEMVMSKNEILKMSNMESNLFTKECICTALLSLMATETFDHITVTSIINRAGVSRGGFYRNYKAKEDVLEEICEELFQYILDFITEHELYENTRKWYEDLFRSIAENAEIFQLLIKAQVPRNIVLKFDEGLILQKLQKDDSLMEQYRAAAIGKALTEVVVLWFRNGMQESPEEMAEMLLKLFFINN